MEEVDWGGENTPDLVRHSSHALTKSRPKVPGWWGILRFTIAGILRETGDTREDV